MIFLENPKLLEIDLWIRRSRIIGKIRKYLQLNEYKDMLKFVNAAKVVFRGKFIGLNIYITKKVV